MRAGGLLFSLILTLLFSHSLLASEAATVEIKPHKSLKKITGFTSPREEMTVTSEVSGRCISITADIGAIIPEDGRIAEIDQTFIKLELEANRIAQDRARRQLAEEEKSLERYTKLLSEKSTPQARLDEVALAADLHRLELKTLINDSLRLAEKLRRHTISAPPGWKVIERYTEPGEYIQTGHSVARLGDFRQLLIPVALSSEEMQQLKSMTELLVYLPEIKSILPAAIYRISPVLDPNTKKIMVDLMIEGNRQTLAGSLRGGMRVELQFPDRKQTGVFEIPSSAVITKYEASWLTQPSGNKIRVIQLGTLTDRDIAVIAGEFLKAGQRYLLHPEQPAKK